MAPNVHNSLATQKKHVANMYRFVGQDRPTGLMCAVSSAVFSTAFVRHGKKPQVATRSLSGD